MEENNNKQLNGSVKELWSWSWPLILSLASNNFMLFTDRVILANFSTDAMNASATAAMFANVFLLLGIGIASILEVFVGRDYGSGKEENIGPWTNQILWLCLFSILLWLPFSFFGARILLPSSLIDHGLKYLQILLLSSPIAIWAGALSSTLTAIGRAKVVLYASIVGNLINILFDYFLILGVGSFPPLGSVGAAIATVLGQLSTAIVLWSLFCSKDARKRFHSLDFRLDLFKAKELLKVGTPAALGHCLEIISWAFMLRLAAEHGHVSITLVAVTQGLYSLIAFVMEGLSKAVCAFISNLIGAKQFTLIGKTLKSAYGIIFGFTIIYFFLLITAYPLLEELFLAKDPARAVISPALKFSTYWIGLYFCLDGFVWIHASVLSAFKRTKYVLIINTTCVWLFAFAPFYFLIIRGNQALHWLWPLTCVYALVNSIIFYLKQRQILQNPLHELERN